MLVGPRTRTASSGWLLAMFLNTHAACAAHACGSANDTAFVYIGSDLDAYQLHHLMCSETRIVYIDPLVYWRNSDTIARHSLRGAAPPDALFECELPQGRTSNPACTSLVAYSQVREFSAAFIRALHEAAACKLSGGGLRGLRLHGHSLNSDSATRRYSVHIMFESAGVNRSLTYLIGRTQDVDLDTALDGRAVSTLVTLGVSPTNVQAATERICGEGGTASERLRLLHNPTDTPPVCEGFTKVSTRGPTIEEQRMASRPCVGGSDAAHQRLNMEAATTWLKHRLNSARSHRVSDVVVRNKLVRISHDDELVGCTIQARVEWLHQYSMAGVRTGPGSSSASMPCTVIGLCVQGYEFFRGRFANACKPRPTIEYTARMYRTRRALLAHRPACGRRMRAS